MGESLGFKDIIKNSILQLGEFGSINILDVLTVLSVSLIVSLFIFLIYRKTYRGVSYNNSFNISLVLLSLITSVVILTVSSNVVLSLGMVGALSIVRYRTPIKEPMDIVFIFWAIAIGISTGAKFYMISVLGSVFISIVLLIMTRLTYVSNNYLLIVHYEKPAESSVLKKLEGFKYQIKSKTVSQDKVELTLEIKCKADKLCPSDEISSLEGVTNTILVKASISGDAV